MANFTNIQSLAAFKAANGNNNIEVGPSPKEGIFLFSCGAKSGYVSAAAYDKYIAKDDDGNFIYPDSAFQYADVVDDDNNVWSMITLAGNSGPTTVVASR